MEIVSPERNARFNVSVIGFCKSNIINYNVLLDTAGRDLYTWIAATMFLWASVYSYLPFAKAYVSAPYVMA